LLQDQLQTVLPWASITASCQRRQQGWEAVPHLGEGDLHVQLVQALEDDLAELGHHLCVCLRDERLALGDLQGRSTLL
jgi:hypothetical protein